MAGYLPGPAAVGAEHVYRRHQPAAHRTVQRQHTHRYAPAHIHRSYAHMHRSMLIYQTVQQVADPQTVWISNQYTTSVPPNTAALAEYSQRFFIRFEWAPTNSLTVFTPDQPRVTQPELNCSYESIIKPLFSYDTLRYGSSYNDELQKQSLTWCTFYKSEHPETAQIRPLADPAVCFGRSNMSLESVWECRPA